MKKLLLFSFFFLFFAPIVSAEMDGKIYAFGVSTYNLGQSLGPINGYVKGITEDFNGSVELYLDEELKVSFPYAFSRIKNFVTLEEMYRETNPGGSIYILLQNVSKGDHYVDIVVYREGNEVLRFFSEDFTVTDELRIYASTDKEMLSLGEDIRVVGSAYYYTRPEGIVGYMTVLLENQNYSFAINGSSFSHLFKLDEVGTGKKTLKVTARDGKGNKGEAELSFVVVAKLTIDYYLNKPYHQAGETVVLKGTPLTLGREPTNASINATLVLGNETIFRSVYFKSAFNFSFELPKNIEAGTYTITLNGEDRLGNKMTQRTIFLNVTKTPTSVSVVFSKEKIDAGEDLGYEVFLYDQTHAVIKNFPLVVNITSPLGESVEFSKKTGDSGKIEGVFETNRSSVAGKWLFNIKALDKGFNDSFEVKPRYDYNLSIDDVTQAGDRFTFLYTVKNNGNIEGEVGIRLRCSGCIGLSPKTISLSRGEETKGSILWYYPSSQPVGEYPIRLCIDTTEVERCSEPWKIEIYSTVQESTNTDFMTLILGAAVVFIIVYGLYYFYQQRNISYI